MRDNTSINTPKKVENWSPFRCTVAFKWVIEIDVLNFNSITLNHCNQKRFWINMVSAKNIIILY